MEFLDAFIKGLLHTDDVRGNKLLDVGNFGDGGSVKAYRLFAPHGDNCKTMLQVIKSRRGKPSNKTVLAGSALVRSTVDNPLVEKWEWSDLGGCKDAKALDKFISEVYNALDLKGNNPLFLGVGILTWTVAVGDDIKTINSPLLIFPIRFVRGTNTGPVEVEIVDDDAFFNPCLIGRMTDEFSEDIAANFPHPNGAGASFDDAIDLDKLGDGTEYMQRVSQYVATLRPDGGDIEISFDKDILTIAQYNHSDICMYYDVRRNKQKIYAHPLVRRVFGCGDPLPPVKEGDRYLRPVLPIDSVQEYIIADVANGKSLIVKGPPGTGKTLTIANMIATLLARGKSVLVASEKLSALAEVFAKLPDRLRKFVMLLDYETEQKAAAVDPAVVRAEFKRLIKDKREYVYDSKNDVRCERAERAKAEAMIELAHYRDDVFSDDVAWGSYYDAIDIFYKDVDLPEIPFADCGAAAAISRDDYNKLLLRVKEAAEHYAHLAGDGKITDSPWYGVHGGVDTERAMSELVDIAASMTSLYNAVMSAAGGVTDIDWDACTFGDIHDAATATLTPPDVRKVLSALSGSDGELLEMLVDRRDAALDKPAARKFEFPSGADDDSFARLAKADVPCDINVSVIKNIAAHGYLFLRDGVPLADKAAQRFAEIVTEIAELASARDEARAELMFVMDKAKPHDDDLIKACAVLAPYRDGKKKSLGFFDLKAKAAEKRLHAVCSRSDISLAELAGAAAIYIDSEQAEDKIVALGGVLASVMGVAEVTDADLDCILTVVKISKSNVIGAAELAARCVAASELIDAAEKLAKTPADYTLSELADAVELWTVERDMQTAVASLCAKTETTAENVYDYARAVAALLRVYASPQFGGDLEKTVLFAERMRAAGAPLAAAVTDAVRKLKAFGAAHFANTYTRMPWHVRVGSHAVVSAQARDRSALNAALEFDDIVHGKNALPLDVFFAPLTDGSISVPPARFVDMFVHSYYALVIKDKMQRLDKRRNGLAKNAELAIKSFRDAESEIHECNVLKTENLCMARIDPDDDDFDFLAVDKGIATSLRVLFRRHANALLKLKKCFITSPSTVSVLFRGEAYENFDVVIVDEASQMEPVDILPVLFRSKQCVLVGDEFQMPPLTHFKAKNRKRICDPESELTLDTDISALSLALGNLAFDAEELVCHYRSRTETLIEFSQREFYPYMRTFPATVPATDELGFTDVLTENGYCDDGVNPIEAAAVVDALHRHFDKYYDKAKGALSSSVGVVTFGEAQLKYVRGLVANDKKLNDMIETAWRNFDDVPDKLVFFRTIESVQGQETDDLILSLTYGKDKNGKVKLAFGELNRDATGKNIFNVAVTRARGTVTVIHSVTAQQLYGNPRIDFIRSYLASVERYAKKDGSQFVSGTPEKGASFVASVAGCIAEAGIDAARIVTDYGVTEGSVRIPVAVLSKDLKTAELGVWCEYPVGKKYDYFDYNARYFSTLTQRGWNLHKIYIHDWYDNAEVEKTALRAVVDKYVTK